MVACAREPFSRPARPALTQPQSSKLCHEVKFRRPHISERDRTVLAAAPYDFDVIGAQCLSRYVVQVERPASRAYMAWYGGLPDWELLQLRDHDLNDETAARGEMRRGIAEAFHLGSLRGQIHDRAENQIDERERSVDSGRGEVADCHIPRFYCRSFVQFWSGIKRGFFTNPGSICYQSCQDNPENRHRRVPMSFSRLVGILLIVIGLAVNKWTLEATIVFDGSIESISAQLAIAVAQIILLALGTWVCVKPRRFTVPTISEWTLLGISVTVALGLVEMFYRFDGTAFNPPVAYVGQYANRPSENFVADEQTGWRMRANQQFRWTTDGHLITYRSNRQGFRSDRDFEDQPHSLIGVVGDSFTWGTGVDYAQTFGHLLETALTGTQVYNFAQPGFGIDQMWMSVRHQVLPLNPDLIIVAFIDEDFERSLTAYREGEGFNKPRFILDSDALRHQTVDDVPNRLTQLLQVSRLWQTASSVLAIRKRESWRLNMAIVDAIADDCKRHSTSVLFVHLPEKSSGYIGPLSRRLRDDGLEFIDLATGDIPSGIHFKDDGHISALGHRFAASAIIDWFRTRQPQMLERIQK